jgi:hypothetical protein
MESADFSKTSAETDFHNGVPFFHTQNHEFQNILWHDVDPLLGNDREISKFTTPVSEYWLHKQ